MKNKVIPLPYVVYVLVSILFGFIVAIVSGCSNPILPQASATEYEIISAEVAATESFLTPSVDNTPVPPTPVPPSPAPAPGNVCITCNGNGTVDGTIPCTECGGDGVMSIEDYQHKIKRMEQAAIPSPKPAVTEIHSQLDSLQKTVAERRKLIMALAKSRGLENTEEYKALERQEARDKAEQNCGPECKCGSGCKCQGQCRCAWPGQCLGNSSPEKMEAEPQLAEVQWHTSIKAGETEAKKRGSYLLIHFYMDGCPPCQKMDQQVFPNKKVIEYLNRNLVTVRVNGPLLSASEKRRWSLQSYPTDLLLDKDQQRFVRFKMTTDPNTYLRAIVEAMKKLQQPVKERSVLRSAPVTYYEPAPMFFSPPPMPMYYGGGCSTCQ